MKKIKYILLLLVSALSMKSYAMDPAYTEVEYYAASPYFLYASDPYYTMDVSFDTSLEEQLVKGAISIEGYLERIEMGSGEQRFSNMIRTMKLAEIGRLGYRTKFTQFYEDLKTDIRALVIAFRKNR